MAGFKWTGSLSGGEPIIQKFVVKNAVVISAGEMLNLESGEADAAATGDAALIGAAMHDVDNTADGEYVYAIVNPDAIYRVVDANARAAGATLDLATGAMGVAASSNADLLVVSDSTSSQETRVTFNGKHFTQV